MRHHVACATYVGPTTPSIFFAAVFLSLASAGQLFEYWLRVTNQLDRRGFTLAWMERTWPGTPLASASGEQERPQKWRCVKTIDRRMTEPMSVCRGSMLPQNAHEDCTTHHVSRMTARRPPDHDSALRGRVCYEKWPSWLAGGLVVNWWTTEARTLLNDDAQIHTVQSACGSLGFSQCPLVFTHRLASA